MTDEPAASRMRRRGGVGPLSAAGRSALSMGRHSESRYDGGESVVEDGRVFTAALSAPWPCPTPGRLLKAATTHKPHHLPDTQRQDASLTSIRAVETDMVQHHSLL